MKHPVRRFKSLTVALKELEPFIRDGKHLETGKPFKRFGGLRSRELLANWLLCAVFNFDCAAPERLTFTTDPLGGDGILYLAERLALPLMEGQNSAGPTIWTHLPESHSGLFEGKRVSYKHVAAGA